ncbi:MAG: hypothetical protein HXY28_09780 [Hydrogenophilaceae bacterium]|jgi:hypothetical protein|nr:hypothetical protein [Hydrogenophilaceae bacterium]
MHRRALLAAAFVLSACAATPRPTPQRYEGRWDFHFETSSFTTADGEGPWWLAADGEVWPILTAPFAETGGPWGVLEIVIEGELSEPGRYGHLGAYERELRVTRVISSRQVSRND